MKNLTEKQLTDLLLTKAMAGSVGNVERWNSLNDVIDEAFEYGAIDREDYLHSVMELTQLGFVNSDIKEEEDIKLSEAEGYDITGLTPEGYDITGLTPDGEAYIEQLNPTLKEKVIIIFKKVEGVCGIINGSETMELLKNIKDFLK